jgi:hypothetical protein
VKAGLESALEVVFAVGAALGALAGLHVYLQSRNATTAAASSAAQIAGYDTQAAQVEQNAVQQADINSILQQYATGTAATSATTAAQVAAETQSATITSGASVTGFTVGANII